MRVGPETINMLNEITKRSIIDLVKSGKRADDRDFNEMRKLEINPGVIPYASGSALVKLGKTMVLAGVKLDPGTPFPDTPNEGTFMVNTELLPFASPEYEYGPPGAFSVSLARIVDRGIRSAEIIDLEKLFIEENTVWCVFVDIDVLNNDGNLVDACSVAAMTALLNARIPKFDADKKQKIPQKFTGKLPVKGVVATNTWAKIDDKIVRDPTADEEIAMDGNITFSTYENNICAVQKNGAAAFTQAEIDALIDKAFAHSDELKSAITKAV